jgi:glycosyltransferase involved in cell wall biosynthesis
MLITVCISTVRPDTLEYSVRSILSQTYRDWELIIVSQGGSADLQDAVCRTVKRDGRIRNIHLNEKGLSRGRNAGIEAARGEVIAFTDDDCEAPEEWLQTIAESFQQYPEAGLLGGSLIAPDTPRSLISTCPEFHANECYYDPRQQSAPPGYGWAGGDFALRTSVAKRVGPFDIYLGAGTSFPCCEDIDYGLRVEKAGVVCISSPRVRVYHTYGRRYGVRAVWKHLDNYAVGRGAFLAKLKQIRHPLAETWEREERSAGWSKLLRKPHRFLIDRYFSRRVRYGYEEYNRLFRVENGLSVPVNHQDQRRRIETT